MSLSVIGRPKLDLGRPARPLYRGICALSLHRTGRNVQNPPCFPCSSRARSQNAPQKVHNPSCLPRGSRVQDPPHGSDLNLSPALPRGSRVHGCTPPITKEWRNGRVDMGHLVRELTAIEATFTPAYMQSMMGAAHRINPKLAFVPCLYYDHITPPPLPGPLLLRRRGRSQGARGAITS